MASEFGCAPRTGKTSSSAGVCAGASAFPPKDPILRFKVKGPSKAQFERIFQTGVVVKCPLGRIRAAKGTGLLGIAISKKLGSHPVRNKLKRRCREAVRVLYGSVLAHLDYVIVLGEEAAKAPQAELVRALGEAIDLANKRARQREGSEVGA
jgi:ribonuclease P protein component